MEELQHRLYSLSQGSIDRDDVEKHFGDAAITLLQHVKIVTPHDEYVIRELEWYYHNPAIDHTDEYCHRGPRQSTFGNWYLHRYGKDPHAFLRSRRNGIDITFGNPTRNIHGGILLRSIQSLNEQQPVSGINKVMRELVRSLTASQLHDLATSCDNGLFDSSTLVRLQTHYQSDRLPVMSTARIGLASPHNDNSKKYYHKPYRYYN